MASDGLKVSLMHVINNHVTGVFRVLAYFDFLCLCLRLSFIHTYIILLICLVFSVVCSGFVFIAVELR